MNKRALSIARPSRAILLGSGAVLIAAQGAWAANQSYDSANPNNVWDTTTANWMDPTVWVGNNIADFGGTGESVSVNGAIEVGGMTFTENGYVITNGAGSLDLGTAGSNMFTVAADVSAEVSEPINGRAGEFITKAGAGTLTLSGGVHAAEKLTMTAGVLDVSGSGTALKLSGSTIMDGTGGTIHGTGGGKIVLDNATGNSISPGGPLTVNAIIADGAGNKVTFSAGSVSGSSTVLTGANTWTGATTIFAASGRAVSLSVSSIGSWGSGIAGNLGAPATSVDGTIGITLNNASSSAVFQYTGAGETTNRDFLLSSSSGTVVLDHSGTGLLKLTGNITSAGGNRTLKLRGSGSGEVTGNIFKQNSNLSLTKEGAGTWTISGANSLLGGGGTLNVHEGMLVVGSSGALGTPGTAIPTTIILGGGTTLKYTGSAAMVINRTFTLGNANGDTATLDASGTDAGTFSFTSPAAVVFANTNAHTLNLTGSNTGANTVAAAIGDNTGLTSVNKTGAGTWVLSGANTYTGGTMVETGTLRLNNTSGSGSGTGTLTVKTGATLGGSGTAGGATTIEAGATVAPGNSIGTLTLASASLAGAYECQLDAGTGDRLTVTGGLAISPGATITISTVVAPTAASYTILSYGSLSSGSLPAITPPSGYAVNTATPGEVKLVKIGGGYSSWSALNAPSGMPSDDYDGDGVSNAVEWVLGGLAGANDLAKLPAATVNGGNLVFTFVRSEDAWLSGDTTVDIEVGTNLAAWPAVYRVGVDTASSTTPGVEVTGSTVKLTVPMAPDKAKFARLKVSVTP